MSADSRLTDLDQQFPSLANFLYFNHAAISPWPQHTADQVARFARENAIDGATRYVRWVKREQRLREQLRDLIGASATEDIALLKNTTEGICTVAWGLPWKPGQNMVLPAEEFPSNRLPWLAQEKRGMLVREVNIRSNGDPESALIEAMDHDTRLLSVSSVQWRDGLRLDLERLGQTCKQRGVLFFVDAIQHLGALRIDVEACHISFLAADAHKWLMGPEGIAVFYCREECRPQLELTEQGWHMYDYPWFFDRTDWTPSDSARRFEAGSPNSVGQAGFLASLEVLKACGLENVEQRVLENTRHIMRRLAAMKSVEIVHPQPPERRSGIVSFQPLNRNTKELQSHFEDQGLKCTVRVGAIRLSPHFYQKEARIDQALDIIEQAL